MAYREQASNLKGADALVQGSISSNTTTTGNWIDTKDYGALTFFLKSGTITDGVYTPLIEDADAADKSDAATVEDARLTATVASRAYISTDDNVIKSIGYRGSKRYVRLKLVSTGVTTGGSLGAIAVLGFPALRPTT